MSYTYADLKKVEARIQELNALWEQCGSCRHKLYEKISETREELMATAMLIQGRTIWYGPDATSCSNAILGLVGDINKARYQFVEEMKACQNALMDEVHRQQTLHSRIYRELSTAEVAVGRIFD